MDTAPGVQARRVTDDTEVFTVQFPVPGMGLVAINAFLIRAPAPVLVDAGALAFGDAFFAAIQTRIDLAELRWIWLTHTDPDHIGCLHEVLAEAPAARLVTTFLGLGKLGLSRPVPPERTYLLNPGQRLDVGDRELLALRPPIYDAPETTGLFDSRTRTLFSADCFGAVLPEPRQEAGDLSDDVLRDGAVLWATVDSPWLPLVEAPSFDRALDAVRRLDPALILSSHLPPARAMTETLLGHLAAARSAPPFVGPDQKAMEQMLSASAGAEAPPRTESATTGP